MEKNNPQIIDWDGKFRKYGLVVQESSITGVAESGEEYPRVVVMLHNLFNTSQGICCGHHK